MSVAPKQGVLSGLGGSPCKPERCALFRSWVCRSAPAAAESCASPPVAPESGRGRSRVWPAVTLLLGLACLAVGCGPAGRRELLEGQRLLATGHAEAAVSAFREAVRAFSTNAPAAAQAWNHLGVAYHRLGQSDNASLCYKAALDRDLNLFAARYNRGYLYLERTNYAAAISELTTYTTQLPDDPSGWLLLGKAQLRAGLLDPAQQSLQRVRRLPAPALEQAEALNALGVSHARRRKAPEAFQHFEAALNRVPGYAPALLNQAILSQQLNDRTFALQKYQAYLDVATNSPWTATVRAWTNQLTLALIASRTPPPAQPAAHTNPPPSVIPTNVASLTKTSPPPAMVLTSAPPPVARTTPTSAPPAEVRSSSPPALVLTSPPPAAIVSTSAPPPELVRTASPPPAVIPLASPQVVAANPASPEPASPSAETATPPETPAETVQLEDEPAFQPARDAPETEPSVAGATKPAPAATPAGAGASALERARTNTPPATPAPATTEEPSKRSLIARLNPVSWFGSKGSDAEKAQAKAAEEEERARRAAQKEAEKRAEAERKEAEKARKRGAESPQHNPKPAPVPSPPAPAPTPTPAFPRYVYLQPPPPARGNRDVSDQYVAEGVRAHRAGRMADAQAAYARAVEADPASFSAQFNLAVAAFDVGDWKRSLGAYERSLAIAPDDLRARYGLALALERAGYPLDAADELERIIRKDPAKVEAHLAAANLYATTLAEPAKAREHYAKVLELQPNHPQAAMIRRWLGPSPR